MEDGGREGERRKVGKGITEWAESTVVWKQKVPTNSPHPSKFLQSLCLPLFASFYVLSNVPNVGNDHLFLECNSKFINIRFRVRSKF